MFWLLIAENDPDVLHFGTGLFVLILQILIFIDKYNLCMHDVGPRSGVSNTLIVIGQSRSTYWAKWSIIPIFIYYYHTTCLTKIVCQTFTNGFKTLLYSSQSLHLCAIHLGKMLKLIYLHQKLQHWFPWTHLQWRKRFWQYKLILSLSPGLMDTWELTHKGKESKHV